MAIRRLLKNKVSSNVFSIVENEAVLVLESLGQLECLYLKETDGLELKKLDQLDAPQKIRFIGSRRIYRQLQEVYPYWPNYEKVIFPRTKVQAVFYSDSGKVRLSKKDIENSTIQKNVLIVDDSKPIQKLLSKIVKGSDSLNLIGVAGCPSEARKIIEKEKVDLITLDIHMPEMTGVEFLKTYLERQNIPTVMISSVSMSEGSLVMEALANGAHTYIQKPKIETLDSEAPEILSKLETIANAGPVQKPLNSIKVNLKFDNNKGLIAIGSSTGGTQALQQLFINMPEEIPPIIVVQHIPAVFSKALADRLDSLCPFRVKEAEDGDYLKPNHIYIAAGGKQMKLLKRGEEVRLELNDDPPVNRFQPSVDYTFDSILQLENKPLVGVILTGMGADGAKGLLGLKNKGATTIAQDKASSIVYGMPKIAIEIGAANKVSSLEEMAQSIIVEYNRLVKKEAA